MPLTLSKNPFFSFGFWTGWFWASKFGLFTSAVGVAGVAGGAPGTGGIKTPEGGALRLGRVFCVGDAVSQLAICVEPPMCSAQKRGRLRADQVVFRLRLGACACGKLTSIRIHLSAYNPVRHLEVLDVAVRAMLVRPLHELSPDRKSNPCTLCVCLAQNGLQILIVVQADPDDAQAVWS